MNHAAPTADQPPAGPLRRLVAIFYDSLLLIALWMLAIALWLPLTDGEAVAAGTFWLQAYLALVAFVFFAGFWLRGGQTLGMRAWRLRLCSRDGSAPSLGQVSLRFVLFASPVLALALGARYGAALAVILVAGSLLYSLFDAEKRAWHDVASGTRVVVEPKRGA